MAIGALLVLWTSPAGAQQYPPRAGAAPESEQLAPIDVQPNTQVQGAVQVQRGSATQPFAFTGSDSMTLVRIALGAVTVGGMLLLVTRQRLHVRYR